MKWGEFLYKNIFIHVYAIGDCSKNNLSGGYDRLLLRRLFVVLHL